jgi:hypothetical protein
MTPTLPKFTAQHGQCLPAAVAILFNKPEILAAFPAKKNGYLMTHIGLMLPDGVWFDVLYSDEICLSGAAALINELTKTDTDKFIPFFCSKNNHAFLILGRHNDGKLYGFDLLSNKAAQILDLEKFLLSDIETVVVLIEPKTNSLLGLDESELKHLLQ